MPVDEASDLQALQDVLSLGQRETSKKERDRLCWNDEALTVRFPPTPRCAGLGNTHDNFMRLLFGSCILLKNVDTEALPRLQRNAFDALAQLLNNWVNNLGPKRTKSCDELVMLKNEALNQTIVILVVAPKYTPKAQVFARCYSRDA